LINIGVIGYGYWGPNLVRNFSELGISQVVSVSDLNPKRLELLKSRYPGIQTFNDFREILSDPRIDVVVIATPVSTHYQLALSALEAGKHVFVEKPLAQSSDDARRLIEEAEARNITLHVDHTFVYTGAVRKIQELLSSNELGDIYYYDSTRINLGIFHSDASVLWDLAVHDFAIMDHLLGLNPVAISACGISHVPGRPENIAYVTAYFEENAIAHIQVNWLAPVKVRHTLIGGSKKMIVYDDLEPSEKIKVYDKGITVNGDRQNIYDALIGYRTGDMWAPRIELDEALQVECQHFVQCVEEGTRTLTDGHSGFRVVRLLEAASASMEKQGAPVELNGGAWQ
jgi:predicted dehydrogenase